MIEPFKELANIGTFLSALASIANVVVLAIIGVVAYLRFKRYEERQYQSQARASLNLDLEVQVLRADNDEECVFGLTVMIENLGKVTALIDLNESNFVVEQLSQSFYDPNDLLEEKDGKAYLKPFSRLQTQFSLWKVKLAEDRYVCEVEPGAKTSFSNCTPALRSIYRVSVELALTEEGTKEFTKITGNKLSDGERAVWTRSSICDARKDVSLPPVASAQPIIPPDAA
jgi:hypothetical protein